jgi:transcription initiation factor TFIIH subunit 1
MKSSTQEMLAEQYPTTIQQELKQLYTSIAELLRHFWACFSPVPPSSSLMQEKAAKMHETLTKFQMVKLRPFENELARQYSSGPNITYHINQMLESAYRKFETWKQHSNRHR